MQKYRFLSFDEILQLRRWHKKLDENRGDRARLKRAECPEDVLLTDAFFNFLTYMDERWKGDNRIFISAAVAGLLSHVKSDSSNKSRVHKSTDESNEIKFASFAEQLATPISSKKAPFSELRFQQLQKSRSPDAFYRRIISAIRILNGKVNIASLANDIIHWHLEFNKKIDREPNKRLAVSWATDYFTASQLNKN